MKEWKKTAKAPWDYNRNTGVAQYNDVCPVCNEPCYSGALPEGGMLYTCDCGTHALTAKQLAYLAIYNENPQGCDDVDFDQESADIEAWIGDGFSFNDPAGAALAEAAQSERNHEAVDAARPF